MSNQGQNAWDTCMCSKKHVQSLYTITIYYYNWLQSNLVSFFFGLTELSIHCISIRQRPFVVIRDTTDTVNRALCNRGLTGTFGAASLGQRVRYLREVIATVVSVTMGRLRTSCDMMRADSQGGKMAARRQAVNLPLKNMSTWDVKLCHLKVRPL